jgi:preprotein translocase subunit SecE
MEGAVEQPSFGQKIISSPARLKAYVEDLRNEMRRVTWPSWTQVRSTTTVVLIAIFAFGAFFFVVDLVITKAVTKVFDTFTK